MHKKCKYCEAGYVKKSGIYKPCQHCITPERFQKTLEVAIGNCKDSIKKKALSRIQENLPDYPVVALMEANFYGEFGADFIKMLKTAFDVRPFMDVEYRKI
tara:strand:+ start:356 stop:658 length:303 start_codon:yes stop_codon:yes gene_type:complete